MQRDCSNARGAPSIPTTTICLYPRDCNGIPTRSVGFYIRAQIRRTLLDLGEPVELRPKCNPTKTKNNARKKFGAARRPKIYCSFPPPSAICYSTSRAHPQLQNNYCLNGMAKLDKTLYLISNRFFQDCLFHPKRVFSIFQDFPI